VRLHRFFVAADQLRGEAVEFSRDQSHQIRNVLRLRAGDRVCVFDGVSSTDLLIELEDATRGGVVGTRSQPPEPGTKLVTYPALLQRDKFEPVLQKLTEIGVAAIAPVISVRGLVREPPDERRQERWRTILREAAEQCGRGVVPDLLPTQAFASAIAAAQGALVVAYERERRRHLREVLDPPPAAVSLFVGPEGGFTREEAECAVRAGARLVTLGPRVLRTETASPLLAALVLYELGDLSSGFGTTRDDDEPGL
jgi:16S rRNA (uracil1498-N3)-methyltransferase